MEMLIFWRIQASQVCSRIRKVKGTYRLGDQIKIKGFAKAFSGANIDNAEVKYRVVRITRYPYWWDFILEAGIHQSHKWKLNREISNRREKDTLKLNLRQLQISRFQKSRDIFLVSSHPRCD